MSREDDGLGRVTSLHFDNPKDHPAKFSKPILEHIVYACTTPMFDIATGSELQADDFVTLDPFAGVGGLLLLRGLGWPGSFVMMELEPEYAAFIRSHPLFDPARDEVIVGDCRDSMRRIAQATPARVTAVVTSPAYGNRMADSYLGSPTDLSDPDAKRRKKRRHTYAYSLGRHLSPGSGAALQWGEQYRDLHIQVWQGVASLRPRLVVLNCSDHVRNHEVQRVTDFHVNSIVSASVSVGEPHMLHVFSDSQVETRRQKHGANADKRAGAERVVVFTR